MSSPGCRSNITKCTRDPSGPRGLGSQYDSYIAGVQYTQHDRPPTPAPVSLPRPLHLQRLRRSGLLVLDHSLDVALGEALAHALDDAMQGVLAGHDGRQVADLEAAAAALPLLARGPRRAVALAHGLLAELADRIRATPAETLRTTRIRVPDPVKARLAALAIADRLPRRR